MRTTPRSTASSKTMTPDNLQLHGHETPERVAEVKARYGLPVMKALAIREPSDLGSVNDYKGIADRFLFDAKAPSTSDLPGGNGVAFDWSLLADLDPDIDFMLSGGAERREHSARDCGDMPERHRHLVWCRKRARHQGRGANQGVFRCRRRRPEGRGHRSRRFTFRASRNIATREAYRGRPCVRLETRFRSFRHEQARSTQHVPQRPGRAGDVRHFRRPFRCRNADAADPGSAEALGDRQKRRRFQGRARTSQHALHRAGQARCISPRG